ncbi:MAG: RES family NAD+ phosphorylase, partial [Beijerinckiaceae bacterium]
SRFRRAGRTLGVFYGAEHPHTAAAEMAFYRLLFFAESPDAPWPANAAEYSCFSVPVKTSRALDLMREPFVAERAQWTDFANYEPTQALAEAARIADAQLIRYESVRDPKHRANLALLSPLAFARRAPKRFETWRIRVSRSGAQALRELPAERHEFGRDAFADDPRLKDMRWEARV